MALISLSIDYKKAPIEVRSDFSLANYSSSDLYKSLLDIDGVNHVVILSTCNRTEMYLKISNLKVVDSVLSWWQEYSCSDEDIHKYFNLKQGTEVIKHLMKLACGLESMVLGEPQILGQVKQSYTASKKSMALGKELDRVFQKVFATAKKVRSETRIGHCPVSVAFSAISLAKKQLENIHLKKVVIIGAGDTGFLLFKHLESINPKHIYLLNRTVEKAQLVVKNTKNATAHSLDELDKLLKISDIVVAAASLEKYIVTVDSFCDDKERVFIDLSVPRVIDPALGKQEHNVYYCVDDINKVMASGQQIRKKESLKADKIVIKSLEEYLEKERAIISNVAIKELFEKADTIVDMSLEKSLSKIRNGKDPEEIMKRFAYDIKKKVLHYPVKGMKKASKEGRSDLLNYIKAMFGLNMENE